MSIPPRSRISPRVKTSSPRRNFTPLSDRISRDLKKRGFTFVGTTIVYSLLQSAGLVDDHLKGCGWHASRRPPE